MKDYFYMSGSEYGYAYILYKSSHRKGTEGNLLDLTMAYKEKTGEYLNTTTRTVKRNGKYVTIYEAHNNVYLDNAKNRNEQMFSDAVIIDCRK